MNSLRKWKYEPQIVNGGMESCWRVQDLANWLKVPIKNIYNHLSGRTINPEAFRRWGNIIIFIPWRCRELLEMDELFFPR